MVCEWCKGRPVEEHFKCKGCDCQHRDIPRAESPGPVYGEEADAEMPGAILTDRPSWREANPGETPGELVPEAVIEVSLEDVTDSAGVPVEGATPAAVDG